MTMRLTEIPLRVCRTELPAEVAEFLEEAGRRVSVHSERLPGLISGFVPSDFVAVYQALCFIRDGHLACGNSFCEWGSGLGVVASLAAMLRFDAYGIEIDKELFDASQQLAADFDIPVILAHGSFVPHGADRMLDRAFTDQDGGLSLKTQADRTYDDLGLEVRDFDIIFTYPWPNDEPLIAQMFHKYAARGSLLLTYHDSKPMRLRRK
jgi:hypothetical protein